MLDVSIFAIDPENGDIIESETHTVNFVSLINRETYGAPPLVAPKGGESPTAKVGDSVVYINTEVVPAFKITRKRDR